MTCDNLIKKLQLAGCRITKARQNIIEMLCKARCMLSAAEILKYLKKHNPKINRTTVYRELLFLTKHAVVKEVLLSGKAPFYELNQDKHHHLVCLNCDSIKPVSLGKHLLAEEKKVYRKEKFKITAHSLEFYGLCKKCL